MKKDKIFIQIASYRDNQLLPTIKNCIANACHPDNLVFCICWQHSDEDTWDRLDEFYSSDEDKGKTDEGKTDEGTGTKFIIIDVDAKLSKGACWARNQIQQKYADEEYTLQLDSHHRFVPNWDVALISILRKLQSEGYPKPLLTSYIPSFNPENDPAERVLTPWKMNFDRFIPEGPVFFLPSDISNYEKLTGPIKARFYSAHFCFTLGEFCREVQHDPDLYFHGEEITIGVRAYTWGYDLFCPHRVFAWHEYTRKYRKKHWDEHSEWQIQNREAQLRVRKLLGIDGLKCDIDFGKYGLGTVRSLTDYERYAGIKFETRGVQQYTLDHNLPPNPTVDEDKYDDSFVKIFRHCINIHFSSVPETDYDFWVVIFENETGTSIYREDASVDEINRMKQERERDKDNGFYNLWRTFKYINKPPHKYIVWPHSKSAGWCNKIEGHLF